MQLRQAPLNKLVSEKENLDELQLTNAQSYHNPENFIIIHGACKTGHLSLFQDAVKKLGLGEIGTLLGSEESIEVSSNSNIKC